MRISVTKNSIFCTVVLILLICFISVTAEESGSCGYKYDWNHCEWTLDDDGLLTISGNGEMASHPWNSNKVKKVEIKQGVRSIAEWAFKNCNLESIVIPDSIKTIGKNAFYGAYVTDIHIDSISSWLSINYLVEGNSSAFSHPNIHSSSYSMSHLYIGDSEVTSITIPESITSICDLAFNGLDIKSIYFHDGLKNVAKHAFSDCPATRYANLGTSTSRALSKAELSFRIPNTNYDLKYLFNNDDISGVEISKVDKSISSFTIPEIVTSIGDYAFYQCNELNSVSFPDGLVSIGNYAFQYCHNLTSVLLPDGIVSIGICAFEDCNQLTNVSLPDSVTSIGSSAFENCSNLNSFTMSNSLIRIDRETFRNCSSLTRITIPDSVTSIGYYAFNNCNSLISITIPSSVSTIGYGAFIDCSSLTDVTINNCDTKIEESGFSSDIGVFGNCENLTRLTIPKGVTRISYITNCYKTIKSVTILEGVTSIGKYYFSGCSGLESITIPESIKYMGDYSFSGCTNLTDIHIASLESWLKMSLGYGMPNFHPCKLFVGDTEVSNIIIPEDITEIRREAFYNFVNLKSITIPDGVTSIRDNAFDNCINLTSIVLPDCLTSIGKNVFDNCENLTSIALPDCLTTIGENAFNNCSNLTSIIVSPYMSDDEITEEGNGIGSKAFSNCGNLTSVAIPKGIKKIGANAFDGCSNLKYVSISNKVTSIGRETFRNCSSLSSITIPDSVTEIGDYCFVNCRSLRNIKISNNINEIGNSLFSNCDSLVSFSIPESVTSICDSAFNSCSSLVSVSIPDSVLSIGTKAFFYCDNLESITIPQNITKIGDNAFDFCLNLKKVAFAVSDINANITFGSRCFYNPVIICHIYTAPDVYLSSKYSVIYYEDIDINSLRSITLQKDFRMVCGESDMIGYAVFPDDGASVTWVSDSPDVISVENNKATALKPGKATITATVGSAFASVHIEAFMPATAIILEKPEIWLQAKEKIMISVKEIKPDGASASISWSSSDTTIATVGDDGFVKTVKPGEVTIIATTDNGVEANCLLHVCWPVTSIVLDPLVCYMIPASSKQISSFVETSNGNFCNKLVNFSSSDETIATVSEDGLIYAITPGTTMIKATSYSGITATSEVRVINRESIESGAEDLSILRLPSSLRTIEEMAFEGITVQAVILPEGCTTIGSRAFADCKNLVYVWIPKSVTSIDQDAFAESPNVVIDYEE